MRSSSLLAAAVTMLALSTAVSATSEPTGVHTVRRNLRAQAPGIPGYVRGDTTGGQGGAAPMAAMPLVASAPAPAPAPAPVSGPLIAAAPVPAPQSQTGVIPTTGTATSNVNVAPGTATSNVNVAPGTASNTAVNTAPGIPSNGAIPTNPGAQRPPAPAPAPASMPAPATKPSGGYGFGSLNPLTMIATLAHQAHGALLGHTGTLPSSYMQGGKAGAGGHGH